VLRDTINRVTGGQWGGGGGRSGLSTLDPEMSRLLAPDFTSTSSAPGHHGAYQHLSDYGQWRFPREQGGQHPDMSPAGPGGA
jgi:hypothetical protein